MNAEIKALVEHRLRQSRDTLDAGRKLLESGYYRDAINRGYYAMFYAGLALLASRALGTSKHTGMLSLFGQEFVKTGLFSANVGRHLRQAFELRQECDYEDFVDPTREQAEEIIENAGKFLEETNALWLKLQDDAES